MKISQKNSNTKMKVVSDKANYKKMRKKKDESLLKRTILWTISR